MSVAAPSNLTLALGVKSITLAWTDSATAGATHTVYRSRGACGSYVPVISGILTPYIDANVASGEVYAYYVVANVGTAVSPSTLTKSLQFVGPMDQYKDSRTSQDARTDQRGGVAVYTGAVASGCGEYQRLQQLRGKSFLCGK